MPGTTFLDIPQREQAQMLATRRRLRYGDLRSLHVLLWCMAGRTPTEIAACLFCSRSSVYRTVRAYRTGTLAMTLKANRGIQVSAEMRRRWLHELGWVWKHATLVARDDDPHRVERFARIRFVFAHLKADAAMVFADKLAIPLWPKVGAVWIPQGTQLAVMPPGTHAKHDLAGALNRTSGALLHCCGPRKTNARFRDRREVSKIAIGPSAPPGSMWSWITLPSIRPRPFSNGGTSTRG